jgi:DNA polymerase III epsilon subunit family exonuclease
MGKKQIDLAVQLYQKNKYCGMSFLCHIYGVKEGYMFIPFGKTGPERAFWEGLSMVLKVLLKSYSSYHLNLIVTAGYLSINGGIYQTEATSLLKRFVSFSHTNANPYEKLLDRVSEIGVQEKELRKIYGYQDIELMEPESEKEDRKSTSKKTIQSFRYYDGWSLPDDFVCFDCETTGVLVRFARFIELGAVRVKKGKIVAEFHTLVNPGISIPKRIRELTGITNEDVKDAPKGIQAVKSFLNFVKGTPVIVAHNAEYDIGMLQDFCERFSIPCWEGEILCTKKLAKEKQLQLSNYRLETLCDYFQVTNENPHRALSDARVLVSLVDKLYSEGSLF